MLIADTDALIGLERALRRCSDRLLQLSTRQDRREDYLASDFFGILGAETEVFKVAGLFGWNSFKADHKIRIGREIFIAECKKVRKKSEYGYWHAAIQAVLYRCRSAQYPIVCILFDWGRKAGNQLDATEIAFLSKWVPARIYFVRLSLTSRRFIEHNLRGDWRRID